VRRHLERAGTVPLPPELDGAPAVLAAALRLHEAAEQDLRATLSRSGLRSDGAARPERQQRAEYAERALAERDAAVRAVLGRLGEAATGFEPG
jgi:predicted phage gp36 major capsid-like protein